MKTLNLILFFLTPLLCPCQTSPVSWNVKTEKVDSNTYRLNIKGEIAEGWYVYAEDNNSLGLESLHFNFDNENISQSVANSLNAVKSIRDPIFDKQKIAVYSDEVNFSQAIKIKGHVPASIKMIIKGFAANKESFIPIEETKEIFLQEGISKSSSLKLASVDITHPIASCGDRQNNDKSVLTIFFIGFIGGLIALLTPCVFPMVPVTVSYFTNKSANKKRSIANGILYGVFIFLIYLVASLPFHLISNINPQIFNTISTNAWVNVFFFAVFILFALSFFGLFEIRMPAMLTNAAGSKGSLGSIGGTFFMALTLATVSFSCTGPILGSLLVGSLSSNGGAWQLTAGMGGFGLALALPFALFAMFPHWMKSLPKSGGWLEVVKKSLAFVELALAIKFLSNADLVMHWGILKREVFIGLWFLIALGLAFYLFKTSPLTPLQRRGEQSTLRIAGEQEKRKIAKGRIFFGGIALLFALYLMPGLTQTKYANLKLLSGFAPPLSYSIYGKDNVKGKGLEPDVINDYDKALQLAKEQNKPLLIDFTGWACVNCRKMEEHVWTKSKVSNLIRENFILVSLYVDDRKKLREGGAIGDKWAGFEAENFKQVTQPLYVILSPDEKLMNYPVGYTPDADDYKAWLECGLNAYLTPTLPDQVRDKFSTSGEGGQIPRSARDDK